MILFNKVKKGFFLAQQFYVASYICLRTKSQRWLTKVHAAASHLSRGWLFTTLPWSNHSHTLSVPSSSSSSLRSASGMLRYCFALRKSFWWGFPHMTRRLQVQPEAAGSRGWRWAIFLILSPFSGELFLVFCWATQQWRWSETQRIGQTKRAPQSGGDLFRKPGWEGDGCGFWLSDAGEEGCWESF